MRWRRIELVGVGAIGALALAFAVPMQSTGCAGNAHFALIRALERGTASIDRYHWQTCDKSYTQGHFFANKAPGFAFVTLPAYAVLDAVGAAGDPLPSVQDFRAGYDDVRRDVWPLTLWAVVLPAALLLVLMWRVSESVEPSADCRIGAVRATSPPRTAPHASRPTSACEKRVSAAATSPRPRRLATRSASESWTPVNGSAIRVDTATRAATSP